MLILLGASCLAGNALAQVRKHARPAKPPRGRSAMTQNKANRGGASGLSLAEGGKTVFDSNQNVYWLADANLAADPKVRNLVHAGALNIRPGGTMDYHTAVQWVQLLNSYNSNHGWLGHRNWQLPVTPAEDTTCSSKNVNSFGIGCTGNAIGNLYVVGLGRQFPASAVPDFVPRPEVLPFTNLLPSMYWTADSSGGGQATFSFLSDIRAANTPKFNYMHILATVSGAIGKPPAQSGVVAYTSGPAANNAVYDADVAGGRTWIRDSRLPCTKNFGVKDSVTITSSVTSVSWRVPKINNGCAMLLETANDPSAGWIAEMRNSRYLTRNDWELPRYDELQALFDHLHLHPWDARLVSRGKAGPFQNLQPFFYWACQRDQKGNSQSPCNPSLQPPPTRTPHGPVPMRWSYNVDDGFLGTSEYNKEFYVMVYYPAPSRPTANCRTPMQCCIAAGGIWAGGRCK
jgi:hypothetical protein